MNGLGYTEFATDNQAYSSDDFLLRFTPIISYKLPYRVVQSGDFLV